MKVLLAIVLAVSSQGLLAGCPKMDINEYAYMTKKELISEFCSNFSDLSEATQKFGEANKKIDESIKLQEYYLSEMKDYNKTVHCSEANFMNALRVLRKDHGVEEDEIKCNK